MASLSRPSGHSCHKILTLEDLKSICQFELNSVFFLRWLTRYFCPVRLLDCVCLLNPSLSCCFFAGIRWWSDASSAPLYMFWCLLVTILTFGWCIIGDLIICLFIWETQVALCVLLCEKSVHRWLKCWMHRKSVTSHNPRLYLMYS